MSNYLDTSDFGRVAGSLLARRDKIKTRDRNEALILSAILSGINKENKNQQEELANAIANIDVDFKLETARNEELYNNTNIKKQREMYQMYQNEGTKQQAINEKALELFNASYSGVVPINSNLSPYGQIYNISRETRNEEQLDKLKKEINEFKEQAINYYETLQVPEIITPTFIDFNKDAVQAYKNSLERVKDNPELQGAIRKVFYNIFQKKNDDNRVPIGAIYKDELKNISDIPSQVNISADVSTSDIVKLEELTSYDLRKSKDTSPIAAHRTALKAALKDKSKERKDSSLNAIDFEYNGKTGSVFKHYDDLKGMEKINFENRVYSYSRKLQEQADIRNIEGNVFNAEYFLEEAIRQTFLEDSFKNISSMNLESAANLFDKTVEIINFNIQGNTTNVTQGKVFELLQKLDKEKNKDLEVAEEMRILIEEIQNQLGNKPKHEDFVNIVMHTFVNTNTRKTRKDSRR
jgi:hypothetical protein